MKSDGKVAKAKKAASRATAKKRAPRASVKSSASKAGGKQLRASAGAATSVPDGVLGEEGVRIDLAHFIEALERLRRQGTEAEFLKTCYKRRVAVILTGRDLKVAKAGFKRAVQSGKPANPVAETAAAAKVHNMEHLADHVEAPATTAATVAHNMDSRLCPPWYKECPKVRVS